MSQTVRVCVALLMLSVVAAAGAVHAQDARLGKEIFLEKAEPPCAVCHKLKDAESEGEIGPDLDEIKPDELKVRNAVKNGVGNMPPFGDSLSAAEINAVARYVAGAVGAGKGR